MILSKSHTRIASKHERTWCLLEGNCSATEPLALFQKRITLRLLFCKNLLKDILTWLLGNQMLVLWALTMTSIPHASAVLLKSNSYENSSFSSNGSQPSCKCLTVNFILMALFLVWVPLFYWLHNTTWHPTIGLENPFAFSFDTGRMPPFILWRAHIFPFGHVIIMTRGWPSLTLAISQA